MIAERAAVFAHLRTQTAEFIVAGSVEQTGQHSQHCGHEIHQTLPLAKRSFESNATIASHISIALSPPSRRKNLPGSWPGKTGQEKACHVGQITCICSSSQELSPRRETGRGLFESDGDPYSRAHSSPVSALPQDAFPSGRRPNQSAGACARPVGVPPQQRTNTKRPA